MVWGAISLNVEKKLEIVSGTIDSDKYISILDKNLLRMINNCWKVAFGAYQKKEIISCLKVLMNISYMSL